MTMKYFIRMHNLESGRSGWYPGSYDDAETALAVAAGLNLSAEFNGTDNYFEAIEGGEPSLPDFLTNRQSQR
jgi:hypothetical protein